jgi:hypothetical protein
MKKQEFLSTLDRLATTDLIRVAKKGEHLGFRLGYTCIGSTTRQNEKIWRHYGSLNNIIIYRTANEVNRILDGLGVTSMRAFKTKSGDSSRLRNV